jgi:alkanesulfonate monooxygenase SsuD/methylene tetrahydromethanopterin reductase-like flavin-dependent oxidoreductase (luciferase family)
MRLGLFSMPSHPPHRKPAETYDEDLELLIHADRLGYDEAWLGEHYTSTWENIPSPELVLAQALALTKQIKLGTGVTCVPNHNPAQLAYRIAQLDNMGKGRFMWGVGAGGFAGDATLFEIPQDGVHRRVTQEYIDAILRIWADEGEGFSWRNEFAHFTVPANAAWGGLGNHLKPWTKPHPPIAVAGVSKSSTTLRWAGERGWIPMSINFVNATDLVGHWVAYEEGSRAGGHEPRRSEWRIARDVYVAETDEQARREALEGSLAFTHTRYFLPLLKSLPFGDILKDSEEMRDEDVTLDYLLEKRWFVGSPETVANQIRALYERVGAFGTLLMLCYDWEGENGPRWKRSMELLANEVAPRVADLTGGELAGSIRSVASAAS